MPCRGHLLAQFFLALTLFQFSACSVVPSNPNSNRSTSVADGVLVGPLSAALSSPSSTPNNNTTPTLAVLGSLLPLGGTLTIYGNSLCNGPTYGSLVIAAGSSSSFITTDVLAEASYLFYFKFQDSKGNTTCSTDGVPYDLDTTPPTVPGVAFSSPASSPSNDSQPAFSISPEGGGNFTAGDVVTLFNSINCGAGTDVGSVPGVGASVVIESDTAQVSGNSNTYSAQITDAAGNTTCSSAHGTVAFRSRAHLYDGTPPAAPAIAYSSPNAAAGTDSQPTFSISLEGGGNFAAGDTVELYDAASCGGDLVGTIAGAGASVTIETDTALANGTTQTYSAKVIDAVGNSTCSSSHGTAASRSKAYLYDTTAPAAPAIAYSSPNSAAGTDSQPTFSISLEGGGNFTAGDTVELYDAAACGGDLVGTIAGTGASVTIETDTAQANGNTTTYSAKVTDLAGNSTCSSGHGTAGSRSKAYLYDITAPAAPAIAYSSPNAAAGTDSQPTFSISLEGGGNFTAGDTVELYDAASCGGDLVGTIAGAGASVTIETDTALSNGTTQTYSAKVTDLAGNSTCSSSHGTAASRSKAYLYDTTAPAAPAIAYSSPSSGAGTDSQPTFSISLEGGGNFTAGDTVELYDAVACGGDLVGTIAGAGASVTIETDTALANGTTQTYSAKVTDLAGNSTCSSSHGTAGSRSKAYLYDITAPAAPAIAYSSPASGAGTDSQPTFSISLEGGGNFATGDTVTLFNTVNCGAGTDVGDIAGSGASVTIETDTAQANGNTSTYSARVTDSAGNSTCSSSHGTAASRSKAYLYDITPPAAPAIAYSDPASSPGNDAQPEFSISLEGGGNFSAGDTVTLYNTVSCGAGTDVGDIAGSGASVNIETDTAQSDGSTLTYSARVTDSAGNSTCSSSHGTAASRSKAYLYNAVAGIAVTVNRSDTQLKTTDATPISFDVTFDSAITAATFTNADITQNGTATGITWNIANSGDDTNFTLTATAVTGEGTVIPSIGSNKVTPVNDASTSTDNTVLFDNVLDEAGVVQIASGGGHACALTSNGKAYCWGFNSNGSIGDGGITVGATAAPSPSPVAVTNLTAGSSFVQLSAGAMHSCGIASDGKAYCWGSDFHGRLGKGTEDAHVNRPNAVSTTNLTAGTGWLKISAGNSATCGIATDGRAFCWGEDGSGVVGDNVIFTNMHEPTALDISNLTAGTAFVDIGVGASHACGLASDGKAYCWGDNNWAQLGLDDNGTIFDRQIPVAVNMAGLTGGSRFIKLAVSSYTNCGLTSSGKLYCWGADSFGNLGNGGANTNSDTPLVVTTTNLTAGTAFVDVWSSSTANAFCARANDGKTYCWGYTGTIGTGEDELDTVTIPTVIAGSKRYLQAVPGGIFGCGFTDQYVAHCWSAAGTNGYLGNGDASNDFTSTPVMINKTVFNDTKSFVHVAKASTSNHSCAIASDGITYCWGYGSDGQVGDGGGSSFGVPTPIDNTGMTAGTYFTSLSVSETNSCGIGSDGITYCWGQTTSGANGHGSNGLKPVAVNVTNLAAGASLKQVASGSLFSCGIASNGNTYCWGSDADGRLGNAGANADVSLATIISSTNITANTHLKELSLGFGFACGIGSDGTTYCWGADGSGQLGDAGAVAAQNQPVAVSITNLTAGSSFVTLDGGYEGACGIASDGKSYCWGNNAVGQLGVGSVSLSFDRPTVQMLTNLDAGATITKLSLGNVFGCGLASNGENFCWGSDSQGYLGNGGGNTDVNLPVLIDTTGHTTGSSFTQLLAGSFHILGITSYGVGFSWGSDGDGQLGDGGANTDSNVPVAVDQSGL
jgi:alpha-tubulin suppressor-like RCC1 family protein